MPNPTLTKKTFNRYSYLTGESATERMTVEGTVTKSLVLVGLVVLTGIFSWAAAAAAGPAGALGWLVIGMGGGLVLALATVFKPTWAPATAPMYALAQGCFLGAISEYFNVRYPGIAALAATGTVGVMATMLAFYRAGIIRATQKFRMIVVGATGAVALCAIASIFLAMFGISTPMSGWGPLAIGVSLVIIVIAALNFILDFDLIEQGAAEGLPKFMEWYAAFSLLVTIVWLYIRMLQLLAQLQGRR